MHSPGASTWPHRQPQRLAGFFAPVASAGAVTPLTADWASLKNASVSSITPVKTRAPGPKAEGGGRRAG